MELFGSLQYILSKLPVNIFDLMLIALFFFYVYDEAKSGAKHAISNLSAIISGFIAGLFFYSQLSKILVQVFSVSKGVSDAISFVAIALLVYIAVSKLIFLLARQASGIFPQHFSRAFAIIAGTLSFLFIASFLISILISFPVSGYVKSTINTSITGRLLLQRTQALEVAVKKIFGSTIDETLNFLTVKPDSDSMVSLHFTVSHPTADNESEKTMLEMVNTIRKKYNLPLFEQNDALTKTARLHATDMFQKGYFSHYTKEGYTPFDRLSFNNISYLSAAENLAYAPDAQLALSGLMNSEGHRKNLLDPTFHKIGIGVMDGKTRGKMFVQLFTD